MTVGDAGLETKVETEKRPPLAVTCPIAPQGGCRLVTRERRDPTVQALNLLNLLIVNEFSREGRGIFRIVTQK